MRKAVASVLAMMLAVGSGVELLASATAGPQQLGTVTATVTNQGGASLADYLVRVRHAEIGDILLTAATEDSGEVSFLIAPGPYLLEVLSSDQNVIGTSAIFTVTPGNSLRVSVVAQEEGTDQNGRFLGYFSRTAGAIVLAVSAIGVSTAVVAAQDPVSP